MHLASRTLYSRKIANSEAIPNAILCSRYKWLLLPTSPSSSLFDCSLFTRSLCPESLPAQSTGSHSPIDNHHDRSALTCTISLHLLCCKLIVHAISGRRNGE